MRKHKESQAMDDLRLEYDAGSLNGGVRGKYLGSYNTGSNLVLLAPDVAAAFPSDQAVNNALRSLINEAKNMVSPAA